MSGGSRVSTKRQLARALMRQFSELRLLRDVYLLRIPYQGVLQGLAIEGSPQGYLWRISLFAFLPVLAVRSFILSNAGKLDHLWWDSRTGTLVDGKPFKGRGGIGGDFVEAVRGVYEVGYRPWLAARETPSQLMEHTEVPQPADHWHPPVWYSSQLQEMIKFCLMGLACGRIAETSAKVDEVLSQLKASSLAEQLKQPGLADFKRELEQIAQVLSSSPEERGKWIRAREDVTFKALNLDRDQLQGSG